MESLQEDIASSRGSSRNGGSHPPSRRLSRNGNTSDGGSCTCYQCNSYGDLAGAAGGFTTSGGGGGHNKNSGGRRKTSKTSMIADENSNLVVNTGKDPLKKKYKQFLKISFFEYLYNNLYFGSL